MPDLVAYAGAFVVGEMSEITLNDPDEDGDLQKYDIKVIYTAPDGKTTNVWQVLNKFPIVTTWKDDQGAEHSAVNSMVLLVLPELPPPGCLGLFLPSFPRFRRGRGVPADPPSTGTVTGTLTPPPGGVRPVKGDENKKFKVATPSIYYGTQA